MTRPMTPLMRDQATAIADTARAVLTPDAPAVEPLGVVTGVLAEARCRDAHPLRWPGKTLCNAPCQSCLSWAAHVAAAVLDALGTGAGQAAVDAMDEVERRINALRNEQWQQHLRDHPLADGTSCPRDYGIHDALASAANIVREYRRAAVTSADDGDRDSGGETVGAE